MKSKKATKRALLSSALSLVLCFSMLLGTTFAWFTDEAKTGVNTIQAGTLDVELLAADGQTSLEGKDFQFKNLNGSADILWEPGVTFVTDGFQIVNKGDLYLKFRAVINGITKGSAKLLEVIDFYIATEKPTATTNLSTLTKLADFDSVDHKLAPGETYENATLYLVGHMDEDAGNDYQGLSIEGVGLTIFATQVEAEFDSFSNDYDAGLKLGVLAKVSDLNELKVPVTGLDGYDEVTLDVGYQFEPDETADDAEMSPYRYWHADFVVSADKDVPAKSMALAGYYALYCNNLTGGDWVALASPDPIAKNTEIRLVEAMGVSVNYEEICRYGNDGIGFRCGAVDLTGANAGTTITVELRLYETETAVESNGNSKNVETGKYVVIGKYEYTFPVTPVAATTQTELNDAIANSVSKTVEVELADGDYTLPSVSGKDVTISGTEDTVITVTTPNYSGSDVTFEGVTIQGSGYSTGVQHVNTVTYNDATINGEMCLYGEKVVFNDCTFELASGQYIWTYGAKEVEFNNCTFNTAGKAILIYNEGAGASDVTVKGCTFNATAGAEAGAIAGQNCAAIEIDNFQSSGTGAAHVLTTDGNTYDSNFSGEWRIKNYVNGNPVTVNGDEYTQIALDGKLMTKNADNTVTVN